VTRRLAAVLLSLFFLNASLLGGAAGCAVGAAPQAEAAPVHHSAHGQHGSAVAPQPGTATALSTADVPSGDQQQSQCDMAMTCSMFASKGEAMELSDRPPVVSEVRWAHAGDLHSVRVAPEPPPPRA